MDDLFNFDNTDNILGNTSSQNLTATAASNLNAAQRSHSNLSDGGNNDITEQKEEKNKTVYRVVIVGDPQVIIYLYI